MAVAAASVLGACGGDDGDLGAFCRAATDDGSFATVFSDFEPTDVDAVATFREARRTQEELRDVAPKAARADIEIVLSFVDDLVEGLEETDPEVDGRPPVYEELKPRFDEVEAASSRLEVYVSANCR